MDRAGAHGGDGIGRRALAVVVAVDADGAEIIEAANNSNEFPRQGAAVGVAQYEGVGTTTRRGAQGLQRVLGICLVAVEEVLGVVDDLTPGLLQVGDRSPR